MGGLLARGLFTVLVWAFLALCTSAQRLLVVHDASIALSEYSGLWDALKDRGLSPTFRKTSDTSEDLNLYKYNEPQFDQVFIIAPQAKSLAEDLSPQSLYKFMTTEPESPTDLPHNVFFALSPSLSEKWRGFAREFGIEFEDSGSFVQDFFSNFDNKNASNLALKDTKTHHALVDPKSDLPIVYSGIAHSTLKHHPMHVNFLVGNPTTFTTNEKGNSNNAKSIGKDSHLITGFQTAAGSRVVWSGSHDIFSNKWWSNKKKTSNAVFNSRLLDWVFTGDTVLTTVDVQHERVGGPLIKNEYRKKDYMTYTLSLSTVSGKAPPDLPLQLEVTMLDPHLRVPLEKSNDLSSDTVTVFTNTVRLPDRHGVFTLLVDYRDPQSGYTPLEVRQTISITPLRHDEHARFLTGAWPYYAGAISSIGGFLLFVALWVSAKDTTLSTKGKKKSE